MRAGGLSDTRLVLMRPTRLVNSYGEEEPTWQEVRTVRAERVKMDGHRSEEVGEQFPDYSVRFNIRFAHPVEENWRVRQTDGHLYSVTNIIPNRRRGMKTLVCDRVNE